METTPFAIEYSTETPELTDELKAKIEKRMEKLTRKHKDVTGAAVAVRKLDGDTTSHAFKARVVIYRRPENIVAVEKGDTATHALRGAMEAAERQVRKHREMQRERYKSA